MRYLIYILLWTLLLPNGVCLAAVEIGFRGQEPVVIQDVYMRQGKAYVAIDDVLAAVALQGSWQSVEHKYIIRSPSARGWIAPGIPKLFLENRTITQKDAPRFIDGRLRVSEDFIRHQLPLLSGQTITLRNLEPVLPEGTADDTLDPLFSFLLRKTQALSGPALRAVAIDAAHGGLDTGVVVEDLQEKEISLQLARNLEKQIKMRLDVPVYLSRDADYSLTKVQRLAPAKKEGVDAWILLHAQASFDPDVHGVALFVRRRVELSDGAPDNSFKLAHAMADALRAENIPVQGIYRSDLLGLGQGNLPTVQVECGYLTHPKDQQRLQVIQSSKIAKALFEGLERFATASKESHR